MRPGLLDELDKRRFVARQNPKWGKSATEYMWKRNQNRRLFAVVAGGTLIVASQANFHSPSTWVILAFGLVLLVLIQMRIRTQSNDVLSCCQNTRYRCESRSWTASSIGSIEL